MTISRAFQVAAIIVSSIFDKSIGTEVSHDKTGRNLRSAGPTCTQGTVAADCYLYNDYCGGCNCLALPIGQSPDECDAEELVACLLAPCINKAVGCSKLKGCSVSDVADEIENSANYECTAAENCVVYDGGCGTCKCQVRHFDQEEEFCEPKKRGKCSDDGCDIEKYKRKCQRGKCVLGRVPLFPSFP
mmetsp:Transcript_29264/g.33685  ORF Transcript_29264/g.33685 Transcript_29264/m.33685 type:complete len:188 (-) Transcript_29264:162-725(-)